MVTVVDFALRKNSEGKEFYALIIQGGIEMVQSKTTGRFYATAKCASIPSTFDELTCKGMMGQQIPGNVVRQDCEQYNFVVKETGEIISLSHRWVYSPEEAFVPPVYQGRIVEPMQMPVF